MYRDKYQYKDESKIEGSAISFIIYTMRLSLGKCTFVYKNTLLFL